MLSTFFVTATNANTGRDAGHLGQFVDGLPDPEQRLAQRTTSMAMRIEPGSVRMTASATRRLICPSPPVCTDGGRARSHRSGTNRFVPQCRSRA